MDKTGIIIVSICVVLLGWWFVEQQKFAQQQALYERNKKIAQAMAAATNGAASTTTTATASTDSMTPAGTNTTTGTAWAPLAAGSPEQTLVLTNRTARYTFTSRGGGLKLIELLDYPQSTSVRWRPQGGAQTNAVISLNTLAPLPALAMIGDSSFVGDGNFTLTRTAGGVRAEKVLPNGLHIIKDFQPSSNYLVNASLRLENTTGKPLTLPAQEVVVGTSTPMDADDNEMYVGVMWCDGNSYFDTGISYFNTNTSILGVFPRTPKTEYRAGNGNVVWAAAHNQFFALMAMPTVPAQEFVARTVQLPAPSSGSAVPPVGIQSALVYPSFTLTNTPVERRMVIFAGPKEYRLLARIGDEFHNHADLAMNFGTGYLSFWGVGTFFAKLLLSGMNWLHDFTSMGYGWTIVVITILLRAMFWPLTAASTRSMKRMQALAPEISALKEKYKDDQAKFTQKQMELWKKHKVNPMSGCLPMLIQMPVFFGFLAMIRCAIELRGAHFLWVADLTKADTLFIIPGLNFPFNLLPLLMVGAMVWQAHLTPPSPSMDASQQKMMRYMPLVMLLFLYNYSSGMALYMTVSTLLSGLQTIMTKNLKDPLKPDAPTVNPALTPASKSKK
jgi:YidC/Oxa1 family membrane protein insertase